MIEQYEEAVGRTIWVWYARDIAGLYGRSRRTVNRWMRERWLRYVRVAGGGLERPRLAIDRDVLIKLWREDRPVESETAKELAACSI